MTPNSLFHSIIGEIQPEGILRNFLKLRVSLDAEISGCEITSDSDLKAFKKNALRYGLDMIRGTYINEETGVEVHVMKNTIKEILNHDYKNPEQLQSIAAIPQIIQRAVYIGSAPNHDTKVHSAKFDYYFCGLIIGNNSYTVRAVIAEMENGTRYYDHKLTPIGKEKLLDSLIGTTPGFSQTVGCGSFPSTVQR